MKLPYLTMAAVVLIAGVIGGIVIGELDQYDPDELCASYHDEGWTHFETQDEDGFYCEAPNGTAVRTVINIGGPTYTWDHFKFIAMIGVVLLAGPLFASRLKRVDDGE